MKTLVLVEDYPNLNGSRNLMYVHTRNLYYIQEGIDVNVLNFSASGCYEIDGINVITYNEYKKNQYQYDLLILHAANIRHHFIFLMKHGKSFPYYLFFFHGHEVLRINKVYPQPFPYMKKKRIKSLIQEVYDSIKLTIWRYYLPMAKNKSTFVFVSNWMKEEFEKWTRLSLDTLNAKYEIIYNCVGKIFEIEAYDDQIPKEYDFITIRGNLDVSKYSIDIINELAKKTPESKFLVVGKGDFFNHYDKSPNIDWRNTTLNHKEIIQALNSAKFALMPTRTDAQGLMMCEMAAFGIPVITSNISVCREIFDGFSNAIFIDNNNISSLADISNKIQSRCIKDRRYCFNNTLERELLIIMSASCKSNV